MNVELWLIRHGETAWSLSGAHTSRTDISLTEQGRKRAEELRQYLSNTTFERVLVSPMQRARETCEIAGLAANAQIEQGLREWDYGESEGKTTQEMRAQYGKKDWSVWTDEIIGGETVEHVGDRADQVIARALGDSGADADRPAKVALFAHAHILRILAARWIRLDARSGRLLGLGTGSVSVLGWERTTRIISHWNRGFEE